MKRNRDRGERRRSSRDRGRSNFKYRKRSSKAAHKRASQRGGNFESPFDNTYPIFTPAKGDNMIRILPPTWEDAEHYGFDVWVHYGLGDRGTFLCPKMMRGKHCPACEEHDRANREGEDEDYVRELKATKRVAVLLIDRDKEKDGIKLWPMPWTVDRDIAVLSEDKKAKEILAIDDPEEGYDISFKREGEKQQTKYIGIAVERRSSPLSDDEDKMQDWLQFIQDRPIPACLNKHVAKDIKAALAGKRGADDEDEDEKEPVGRHSRRNRDDDERPRHRKHDRDDEDEDEIDDEDESLDEYDDDDRPRKKKKHKKTKRLKLRE